MLRSKREEMWARKRFSGGRGPPKNVVFISLTELANAQTAMRVVLSQAEEVVASESAHVS